jgi:regulator of sirC expression with transglutaminase-like and TPR domain
LDQLAVDFQVQLHADADAVTALRSLGEFLGGEQGFRGNAEDYYDPRNSYLNQVMDRRRGIPITLSLVYLEVAHRCSIKLLPVAFPGHFLLKPAANPDLIIDAFGGGRILDAEDCRRLLYQRFGESLQFSETMLAATTKRQLVSRLLQNLKSIYLHQGDLERALRIIDLLAIVSPWDLDQVRDRGLVAFRLGHVDTAVTDLEVYLEHAPPGPDLEAVRETLRRLT